MKATEIRALSAQDLNKKLADLKTELFNLRFQHAVNQLDNPLRLVEVKKDIARVKTVLKDILMSERNLRKTRTGMVVSDKMDKTVVVAVIDNVRHPLYKKIVKRTVKFKAHDEQNACGIGDTVMIMETRPISKDKRWRVVEIIEKAK